MATTAAYAVSFSSILTEALRRSGNSDVTNKHCAIRTWTLLPGDTITIRSCGGTLAMNGPKQKPKPVFSMLIYTDNAAFEHDWQSEVSRILRDVADRLERQTGVNDPAGGTCLDINGNKVGYWHKQ
jgi:hypothetical protein